MEDANLLVRVVGFPATLLYGDTAVFDRWVWLRRRIRKGKVRTLDVGCGSGAFTLYAARVGNEAIGISFNHRNNEVASERARLLHLNNTRFVTGDIRELRTRTALGDFDQIICFETIEHVMNDAQLVQDMARLLRPHGRLLLTTPYKHYHHLPGDAVSETEDGGHVRWGYTHPELRHLFVDAGLSVIDEEYITGPLSQLLIRIERLLARMHPIAAWVAISPFRWIVTFDPLLTKITRYPSLSIAVVGEKG